MRSHCGSRPSSFLFFCSGLCCPQRRGGCSAKRLQNAVPRHAIIKKMRCRPCHVGPAILLQHMQACIHTSTNAQCAITCMHTHTHTHQTLRRRPHGQESTGQCVSSGEKTRHESARGSRLHKAGVQFIGPLHRSRRRMQRKARVPSRRRRRIPARRPQRCSSTACSRSGWRPPWP